MVRELVAVGAHTDVADANADTPLLVAVKERHSAAALELIAAAGTDVRRRDAARHRQPLHYAAELGLAAVAEALLAGGGELNAADGEGRTAVMLATLGGHEAVARLLMDWAGGGGVCDVNVVDSTQRTCLFYAAQLGLVDTVTRLLQVRARPRPTSQHCWVRRIGLCACLVHGCAVQKRTNQSWAGLGTYTCGHKEPCIRWTPTKRGSFVGLHGPLNSMGFYVSIIPDKRQMCRFGR